MVKNSVIAILTCLVAYLSFSGEGNVVLSERYGNYFIQITTQSKLGLHYPLLVVKDLNGTTYFERKLPSDGEDYSMDVFKNIHSIDLNNGQVVIRLIANGMYSNPKYSRFVDERISLPNGLILSF
jgi:hypothetical protein